MIRISFAASVDFRALCPEMGSVLYWYDVAGALPIAMGRGLTVHVTDELGHPLVGGDHPARTRVAGPEAADVIIDAIRELVNPAFLGGTQVERVALAGRLYVAEQRTQQAGSLGGRFPP